MRHQPAVAGFGEVVVVVVQGFASIGAQAKLAVAQVRQWVEKVGAAGGLGFVLRRPSNRVALVVGCQRGDYVGWAPQLCCAPHGTRYIHRHFRQGAQQVHRAGFGYAAGAGNQVVGIFLQKWAVALVQLTQGAIKQDNRVQFMRAIPVAVKISAKAVGNDDRHIAGHGGHLLQRPFVERGAVQVLPHLARVEQGGAAALGFGYWLF